ncbi:MAG: hypothetical protein IPF78_13505 [Flavobacteriales bacterium]|nr:hypothetical protein [Flavobacteriales bacterium]
MIRGLCLLALTAPVSVFAQQGLLPLSGTVDAPWTALIHRSDVAAHSAVRPYFRDDLKAVAAADTVLPSAWKPWMDRMADPAHRWYGGPLVDALAGASFGENDLLKYRAGLGGWVGWNATPRLTFGVDVEAWTEMLPNYLDSATRASEVTPGEGFAHRSGNTVAHYDWNAYADYKARGVFPYHFGQGSQFYRGRLLVALSQR